MRALSDINIESELSYAYIHAVASRAGMSCVAANRHADNNGVDARLTAWGPFPNGGDLIEIDLNLQLKATVAQPADNGSHLSYFFKDLARYNDLRSSTVAIGKILVVLFLPEDKGQWLNHSTEALLLRNCAYWASLRGAPATTNSSGATVLLPKAQAFTPESLLRIATVLSKRQFPEYDNAV